MMMLTSVLKQLIFLIPIILITSCAINPVTGERELMLISEKQELQIGKDAVPSANWAFGGHYRDAALESYLGNIVMRLWAVSERPHLPVKFFIQNSSIPNAFALPGYVAITRGLLSDMENEAQFSAVMGHEIGHVMARHTAQRLSRSTLQQLGLAIGASALEGKGGSDALLTAGALGSGLLLLSYDRNQELQADGLGVRYMSATGYDPYEALSAHEILGTSVDDYMNRLGKSPRDDTFVSGLLSTHPRKDVRLSEIQAMIKAIPSHQKKGTGKFSKTFQSRTKKIREINKLYHLYDKAELNYRQKEYLKAEELLREAINLNNSQSPFYNLLGFIKLQQKNYTETEKAFNRALAIDPDYQPSIFGFGMLRLFEEKYDRAIKAFRDSLNLYPNHAGSYFGIGKSYFKIQLYSKAIPYLEKFSKAAQQHPEVHGLLGICFERKKAIRPAVREYSYQLQVAPNTELGRYAKRRLAILEPLLKQQ
jgi:predicted Zn-dependent protease